MIDVTQQIDSVRRQVGKRAFKAGEARVLTVGRTYDTPLDDVWDACTDPRRIPQWFLPVSGDLRRGGHYQLEGNAGGTIESCEPPKSFGATWEYGEEVSWIELRLTPGEGGTRFELEYLAHVDDERWAEFGPGAVGIGWDLMLVGLTMYLSSGGTPVDPEEVAAWSASEAGRRFVLSSGEAWYGADVASGTDPASARAKADRTAAFYTGDTGAAGATE
ncbi:SRPBCC family protein [Streptomyces sp. HO565]|uniref:SRPBCC family protein n=1 Tax=Streptomyces sp. HO565 TaxID=2857489 RepID=UPI0034DC9579